MQTRFKVSLRTWDKKLKELVLHLPCPQSRPALSSSPESLANGSEDTILPVSAYFTGKNCITLGHEHRPPRNQITQ